MPRPAARRPPTLDATARPRAAVGRSSRHSLAWLAFCAWIAFGADGMATIAYGPEEAFLALGSQRQLGVYVALATALTVFIIALAYNQIIELFPTGGGGYRVASELLGPTPGLVAGAALLINYVLMIALSAAAAMDALFSLLPIGWQVGHLLLALAAVAGLIVLNLHGVQAPLRFLMLLVLAFVAVHAWLLLYGVGQPLGSAPSVLIESWRSTAGQAAATSWFAVIGVALGAYALGAATYGGLEAVANRMHTLAEPRVRVGQRAMGYMALSLAILAGGILLLYLLRDIKPIPGQTMNAAAFGDVLRAMGFEGVQHLVMLAIVLVLEAGLLFVAANAGFRAGPGALANMAADSWVPHQFRYLSSRLVTQNGVLLIGLAAVGMLLLTRGDVHLLVVLYAINVFITFTLALAGLTRYWLRGTRDRAVPLPALRWFGRLVLSLVGLAVCATILVVLVVEKFFDGGWLTLLITALVCAAAIAVRSHYDASRAKIKALEAQFEGVPYGSHTGTPTLDPQAPTAAFVVGSSKGGGMHALLRVQQIFPEHFQNFLFLNARSVDAHSYGGGDRLAALKVEASSALSFYVNFCRSNGLAAKSFLVFGTDPVDELVQLAQNVQKEFPNCIFFTSKLVFEDENWVTGLLHNQAPLDIQRRLHLQGMQMIILPLKL